MTESDLWLTLSEAVGHLGGGDHGKRRLLAAAAKEKITLTGWLYTREGVALQRDVIPAHYLADLESDAIRFDMENNIIEANSVVADFRTFERVAWRRWEDVRVASHEIANLNKGRGAALDAETDAVKWLCARIEADRGNLRTKKQYRDDALGEFKPLSGRAFDEVVWPEAIKRTGATEMSVPGPRKKRQSGA